MGVFAEGCFFSAACALFSYIGADATTADGEVDSSASTSSLFSEDVLFVAEMTLILAALVTCCKVKSSGTRKPKATSTVLQTKCPRSTGARRRTPAYLVDVVRAGHAAQLPQILRSACLAETETDDDFSEENCCKLVNAAMLGCVAHRYFTEAVDAFESVEDFVGCGTGELWGVLLYAAAKAEKGEHGIMFFKRLQTFKQPTTNDFMNVVRCYTLGSDTSRFEKFLDDLKASGVRWDATTREKALGACLSSDCFAFTQILVECGICTQEMDVRAFGSQMKFSLLRGKPARCFDLQLLMKARGIIPNTFTYSLLLEAACRCEDVDLARRIMKTLDLRDNSFAIINCTSLIGSLVDAGMVREAEQVLNLLERRGAAPFASCYEAVARGYRESGLFREGREIMEQMQAKGLLQGARHQQKRTSIVSCGA